MHAALDDEVRVGGGRHWSGAVLNLRWVPGEHFNIEIIVFDHIGERLLDSESVKFRIEVPMGEVIDADRPRWITRVIAHKMWDIDITWLRQDLCCKFVLFSIRPRCQLLIII